MTTLIDAAKQALGALEMQLHGAGSIIHSKMAWDALRAAIQEAEQQEQVAWNKGIRDSVDSLLAQAGFDQDSSARHQLAMMNFDSSKQPRTVKQNWCHVIPGGRKTDEWDSARIGDYNRGWNDYRKAAKAAGSSPAKTASRLFPIVPYTGSIMLPFHTNHSTPAPIS